MPIPAIRRGALWGTLLAVQIAVIGTATTLAAAPSPAHPAGMAGMPKMEAIRTAAAVPSTVTILHQRLVRVTILNFAFHPARLIVSPGTRIVWTNRDSDPHTVDSTKGVWSSQALDTDGTFARAFKATGSFTYYCSIHPFMHGTVIVQK